MSVQTNLHGDVAIFSSISDNICYGFHINIKHDEYKLLFNYSDGKYIEITHGKKYNYPKYGGCNVYMITYNYPCKSYIEYTVDSLEERKNIKLDSFRDGNNITLSRRMK